MIKLSHTEKYVASRAPGGICTLSHAEASALVRLALAAKAENDQRTRLLRGEYGNDEQRYTEDHDRTLRELYEALSAFDFTD